MGKATTNVAHYIKKVQNAKAARDEALEQLAVLQAYVDTVKEVVGDDPRAHMSRWIHDRERMALLEEENSQLREQAETHEREKEELLTWREELEDRDLQQQEREVVLAELAEDTDVKSLRRRLRERGEKLDERMRVSHELRRQLERSLMQTATLQKRLHSSEQALRAKLSNYSDSELLRALLGLRARAKALESSDKQEDRDAIYNTDMVLSKLLNQHVGTGTAPDKSPVDLPATVKVAEPEQTGTND